MAKRLIRLFGFLVHDSPGEAEAECALLQQKGIVDAVLSEDVDTIMFGCTRTLRNWSSEGTKGSKTPTHVSMYDSRELGQGVSGLDREGMVLVALMSGGDYLPEGIPGAGVKLACEAARAGFGKSLCQLKRSNTSALASWKEWLAYELRHNESGFFRTRHKALTIPDDFPNMDILRYYTHPVVSPATTLDRLRQQSWDRHIDVQGLREFVRETFDWSYRIGAVKFIRVLAPCLLVRKLMQRNAAHDNASKDTNVIEKEENDLVRSITTRRAHFSTDATPELRISFIPTSIVGYDFQEEPDEVIEFGRDGLALNSDDEIEDLTEEVGEADSATKGATRKPFSPTDADLFWVPETIARLGIPLMVEHWEEAQRAKGVSRPKAKTLKHKAKTGGMAVGALDKFVKVTKNNAPQTTESKKAATTPARLESSSVRVLSPLGVVPASSQSNQRLLLSSQDSQKARPARYSKPPTPKSRSGRKPSAASKAGINTNPWTIAGSQGSPRVTKYTSSAKASEPIFISSSPPASPPKGASSSISCAEDSYHQDGPGPFPTQSSSPRTRRSLSPPRPTIDVVDVSSRSVVRELSPAPASSEKPQRKLARTESLPLESTRHHHPGRTRGMARAQTVAIESLPSDSEDDDDDDDDFELPPLSSLLGQIPREKNVPDTGFTAHGSEFKPGSAGERKPKMVAEKKSTEKNQATLKQSLGTRMTKLYMPCNSQPGFFKEIDVSVDEADAVREEYAAAARDSGRRGGVWRRSDVSCVDLTGED
jgi:Holliday junction resolvase YEN1